MGEYNYWQGVTSLLTVGIVIKVKDGDTVLIDTLAGDRSFTCRLEAIDSPEISGNGKPRQPYGDEASEELKALVFKYQVQVTLTGHKSYKREICYITKDGLDINREMVARGYTGNISRDLMPAST